MDVKVGKNKYKITFTIVVAIGAVMVSAISWFTMIQVNMATMQEEINSLGRIIENQEDKNQVDQSLRQLKQEMDNLFKASPDLKDILLFFDFYAWVDSKLENKTMLRVLEERYAKIQENH